MQNFPYASTLGKQIFAPQSAYDYIAAYYDEWRWSKFWKLNEAPIITNWFNNLQSGLGLDAGSGTGTYISKAIESHKCVALDISFNMLNQSRRKIDKRSNKALYSQGDVSELPFRDNTFNWILCSRVFSHICDINAVLQEFARVLKPEGECLISDVHPRHPYTQVAIPINGIKIAIETHKHPLENFNRAISMIKTLEVLSLNEYNLNDLLSRPSKVEFEKLYNFSNPPIFYTCKLKKL